MTNPLLVESYKAFGATPTPLPWGEVYGVLQTGIIQGQENPAFFIESTKMHEVTDHITRAGHNNSTTVVMANKQFLDGSPDADKTVIRNASAAAFDYIIDYQTGLTEESVAKIQTAKPEMTITTLTENQRAPFKATADTVEARFLEIGGSPAQAILDQMKADLATAAALLVPDVPLAGIGFACTSAGAVLADDLPRLTGDSRAPVPTLAGGAVRAFRAMGLGPIALMTPYLPETTVPVAGYFEAQGFAIAKTHSLGFADDREMARLDDDALIAAALAADHPEAEALFLSCTALSALDVIPRLEARLEKPVLSANLSLYWAMLDQARIPATGPFRVMAIRTW